MTLVDFNKILDFYPIKCCILYCAICKVLKKMPTWTYKRRKNIYKKDQVDWNLEPSWRLE